MASSRMCSLAEAERQSACKLMCDLATCKPTALLPLQLLARICTHTRTRNSCTSCRAGRQRPRSGRNGVCSACLRHACQRWFKRSKMPLNGPCIPLGAMAAGSLPTGLCQPGLGSGSASPLHGLHARGRLHSPTLLPSQATIQSLCAHSGAFAHLDCGTSRGSFNFDLLDPVSFELSVHLA